jgi:predicted transcriptional regulator
MKVLWGNAPASVQDVQRALSPGRTRAYTTVQTRA